ncbi:MAG: hypothetical protein Q9165_005215 [Trypethelium subeluteriae]
MQNYQRPHGRDGNKSRSSRIASKSAKRANRTPTMYMPRRPPAGQDPAESLLPEGYEAACRNGNAQEVSALISSAANPTKITQHGLLLAVEAGQADLVRYLLRCGASIKPELPSLALKAPAHLQLDVFRAFSEFGWSPKLPSYHDPELLASVVTNIPVLELFLELGADPNGGQQPYGQSTYRGPNQNLGRVLDAAAARGSPSAVSLLLAKGAELRHGQALHSAAGACSEGVAQFSTNIPPSEKSDRARIPVMEHLVKYGADVNDWDEQCENTTSGRIPYGNLTPGLPIVYAVLACAPERVKWLLEHGADPTKKGPWGSAESLLGKQTSERMKQVMEEGLKAQKWK